MDMRDTNNRARPKSAAAAGRGEIDYEELNPLHSRRLPNRPQSAMARSVFSGKARADEPVRGPSVDSLQKEEGVVRSVCLSRGLSRKKPPPNEGSLKVARPRGDLLALREDIWDAVHEMYRVVRSGTADTAWKDEQLDFTGQARISHRPPSAEAFSAGLQDAPAEIITSDVMIADMEVEIKELSASIEAKREIHKRKMAKVGQKMWVLESRVREEEKLNSFLRQVVLTEQLEPTNVDAINDKAVSNSNDGPESRIILLHQSMALMTKAVGDMTGKEFSRIVPPCPDPLNKPLSAAMPIRVWILFVKNYDYIYHMYRWGDEEKQQEAKKAIAEVKRTDTRTLIYLRDQDVDDTKCCLDLMKALVASRHIARLRQLGFRGEHGQLVVVKDDASVRPLTDRVFVEELLRHGDKKAPLMFARTPPGVSFNVARYQENQMAEEAAKAPLDFQGTVMSAQYTTSRKSKSSNTLRPATTARFLSTAGNTPANSTNRTKSSSSTKASKGTSNAHKVSQSGDLEQGNSTDASQAAVNSSTSDHSQVKSVSNATSGPDVGNMVLKGSPTAVGQNLCEGGSWLMTFQDLLNCHTQVKQLIKPTAIESNKRRFTVHRCVEKLLAQQPVEHLFHDAVDALDQKTRSDMLEEVATEFYIIGLLMRTLQSMAKMSEWFCLHSQTSYFCCCSKIIGLDVVGCYEAFITEVKCLLNAEHARLWMVDCDNAQIWEWTGFEKHPLKRSFLPQEESLDLNDAHKRKKVNKVGIAADVARTGVRINVPFPAVQSDSFSIEIDRLSGENSLTILCEPIRHRGKLVAVVQAYNKQKNKEDAARIHPEVSAEPFTSVDEKVLGLLCDHMAELMFKCHQFQDMMTSCEIPFSVCTGLTWRYPCSPRDLFELAQNYLFHIQSSLRAEHCILYVYQMNRILGVASLWTACPDGRRGRRNIDIGEGLAGWAAQEREVVNVPDVSKDFRYDVNIDAAFSDSLDVDGDPSPDFVATNALAVPVNNHDGSLMAVCVMLNKESGQFTEFDAKIIRLECQHVVLMVKTVTANFSYFSTNETIPETLYRCMHIVECERTHLFVAETVERKFKIVRQLRLYASSDEYMNGLTNQLDDKKPVVEVPFSDGLIGYVARTGRDIIISDARSDPRFDAKIDDAMGFHTSSLMTIPVQDAKDKSKIIGILLIANKHGSSAFSRMDRTLSIVFSRQIAKLYAKKMSEISDDDDGSNT